MEQIMGNNGFWNRKKVLITGNEGFLGSNLTIRLLELNADVVGLDIDVKRDRTILTAQDYRKLKTLRGDVADHVTISSILEQYRPEVIFHLAAEAIVGECNKIPVKAFKSNIEGTWNILEASRCNNVVKAIVVASSDKAYGCHTQLPYKEDAPLIGRHPYDVSKSCADLIAYTYFYTYKAPVAITRCGNIYGPGDFNMSRIVPEAMRCALTGEVLKIRSDGKFTRDYVYVDDIVNGYILLAEQLQKKKLGGEAFNFSNENPLSVVEFVDKINKISGGRLRYKILNQAKYEIKHQYLAAKKARRVLGWKPKCEIGEGVKRTLNWYREYLDKEINKKNLRSK
jgi:CDP-glucose 4,6-dehydratase